MNIEFNSSDRDPVDYALLVISLGSAGMGGLGVILGWAPLALAGAIFLIIALTAFYLLQDTND